MAQDRNLLTRIMACAAQENKPQPQQWVQRFNWKLAASPGWDAAWDSAVASGIHDPGNDESVITDGMILAAVQSVTAPFQGG